MHQTTEELAARETDGWPNKGDLEREATRSTVVDPLGGDVADGWRGHGISSVTAACRAK